MAYRAMRPRRPTGLTGDYSKLGYKQDPAEAQLPQMEVREPQSPLPRSPGIIGLNGISRIHERRPESRIPPSIQSGFAGPNRGPLPIQSGFTGPNRGPLPIQSGFTGPNREPPSIQSGFTGPPTTQWQTVDNAPHTVFEMGNVWDEIARAQAQAARNGQRMDPNDPSIWTPVMNPTGPVGQGRNYVDPATLSPVMNPTGAIQPNPATTAPVMNPTGAIQPGMTPVMNPTGAIQPVNGQVSAAAQGVGTTGSGLSLGGVLGTIAGAAVGGPVFSPITGALGGATGSAVEQTYFPGDMESPAASGSGQLFRDFGYPPELADYFAEQGYSVQADGRVGRLSNGEFIELDSLSEPNDRGVVSGAMQWLADRRAEQDKAAQDAEYERYKGELSGGGNAQKLDAPYSDELIDELMRAQQQQRAAQQARVMQAQMEQLGRSGVSPGAQSAALAQTRMQSELAGAQQDAEAKFRYAMANYQSQLKNFDVEIQQQYALANMLQGQMEGARAFSRAKELEQMRATAAQDLMQFQDDLRRAGFGEDLILSLVGGAAQAGGAYGGAKLAAMA